MTDPTPIPIGGGHTGERCEPPGEWREKKGDHYIQLGSVHCVQVWAWSPLYGSGRWMREREDLCVSEMEDRNRIYLFPVPSPSDLAALLDAGRNIVTTDNAAMAELQNMGISTPPETAALTQALADALVKFPEVKK